MENEVGGELVGVMNCRSVKSTEDTVVLCWSRDERLEVDSTSATTRVVVTVFVEINTGTAF